MDNGGYAIDVDEVELSVRNTQRHAKKLKTKQTVTYAAALRVLGFFRFFLLFLL